MKRDDAGSVFKKTEKSISSKNKLFLVFLFIILLVLINLSFISAACVDSDNGKDFKVVGVTTSGNVNKQDFCISSKVLKEYYCENDKVKSMSHRCEVNCLDGVCVDKIIQPVEKKGFLNTLADFFSFRWLFKEVTPAGEPYGCTQKYYYIDEDRDGFGKKDSAPYPLCENQLPPVGYVSDNTDCDDKNKEVHPGATELCNGVDDNCDGKIDEEACQCNDKRDNDDDTKVDFSADPGCTSLLDDDETDTPPGGSGGDSNKYHKACKLDSNNKKTGACEGNVLCKPANIQCPDECDNVGASDTKCIDKPKNYCGDGKVDIGEQCDKGSANSNAPNAECRTDCIPRRCGDSIIDNNYNEKCDKGSQNGVAGSGCTRSCQVECVEAKCKSYYSKTILGKKYAVKEDCKAPCIFEEASGIRKIFSRGKTLGTCSCIKECGDCFENSNCGGIKPGTWGAVDWKEGGRYKVRELPKGYEDYMNEQIASLENNKKEINDQGTYKGVKLNDEQKKDILKKLDDAINNGKNYINQFKTNILPSFNNDPAKAAGLVYKDIFLEMEDATFNIIIFYYNCDNSNSLFEAKFKDIISKFSNPKDEAGNPIMKDDKPIKINFWTLDLGCNRNLETLNNLNKEYNFNKKIKVGALKKQTIITLLKDGATGAQIEKNLKPTISLYKQYEKNKADPNKMEAFLRLSIPALFNDAAELLGIDCEKIIRDLIANLNNPDSSTTRTFIEKQIKKKDENAKSPCIGLGLYYHPGGNLINFIPIKFDTEGLVKYEMDEFSKMLQDLIEKAIENSDVFFPPPREDNTENN